MVDAKAQECMYFVISLEDAHERREVIAGRLRELGLPFQFLPGVDGRKLNLLAHPAYGSLRRRLFWGRDLSNGEFGCILAHRNVYLHMVEQGIERAVVLEDDAILTDELPSVVKALCDQPESWDLVRFLGREKNYQEARIIRPLPGTGSLLSRPYGVPGGAYGYLLNVRSAKRLLSMMERNWLAIDTLHGVVWLTGLKTLSVVPSPVLPNYDVPSCIDEQDASQRWDKRVRLHGWQRLSYPLTRAAWKLYVNYFNKYVWLRTWFQDRKSSNVTTVVAKRKFVK